MRLVRSVVGAALVVTMALALVGSPVAGTAASPPRVTVIADSALTAVIWNQEPVDILQQGFDMDFEVGVCRRLVGTSCPFEGAVVPSLVDLVRSLGPKLAPTVLVEVGYNDYADTFAQSVEEAIAALLAAGAKQILWANMLEWQQQYIPMNKVLVAAASQHSEVRIIDWNTYSRDHYTWFQGDGVHLKYAGAIGMATLFHQALAGALAPPLIAAPARLPVAYIGRPYSARLLAQGGTPPYTWRLISGPLPRGLRLLADGQLSGTPRQTATLNLTFRVTDANAETADTHTRATIERD